MSEVYFTNLRTHAGHNLLHKLEKIVLKAGIENIDFKKKIIAVKIHFGEAGNLAYLRPNYAAAIVKLLQRFGGKPFLTDSNTLYTGSRSNAVDHFMCAMQNGFNPLAVPCPVIIADGLKGTEYREINIDGELCKAPKIGSAIADADIVISMNHFKGHEQAGFGGCIKNLGMGSGSVGGKMEMHGNSQPQVQKNNCTGCRVCVKNCNYGAITLSDERRAVINYSLCVGCGQCVALCQYDGVVLGSSDTTENLSRKIAEYTKAVVFDKPNFHINFIMNVSPECDCWGHNDAAIIPDLGIACSFDPVALDACCADIVKNAPVLKNTFLTDKNPNVESGIGEDKSHLLHPNARFDAGLEHAEKIGVGTRKYQLIEVK
ncbi:MAG: DUF362 domain-containing protein [Bacteroidales bacterium]|jgi:uncharacterized Fe-S center protein|nr:DUF362 domain-containing protein [Bacteroidales bacterium]